MTSWAARGTEPLMGFPMYVISASVVSSHLRNSSVLTTLAICERDVRPLVSLRWPP